ncbi:Xaa-Pro peptidase family protein [Bradyrhizobium sp. ISRA443]|uniref:M24 family metallopeptidase n=1 Tax=unclassified Bradyrhizobium TaxID=2631580 RepID=UPI00247A1526|nr:MULTISPECIES: Xaa-Pro peptidase family protein [unclassified Bradyrhizobium]WGR99785.1 Xaa-Pro peptidase family protein [Bradyrhizobium sp. ISRA436]WGS06675.1 Xaa-Pro peptidase family protein [Bradyrhizobium sp. ISRA437]WGS13559.1 Xaa-Pro peptidase family protein [Bradyrhizobium sp. ISRA443]
MNVADRKITARAPFDTEKLDRLMHEARLDALVVTSRHNVQYLLGGYRFFFFDAMEAIGVSRYLPVYVYQRGRPENALYVGNRMEGFEKELGRIEAPAVKTASWGSTDAIRLAIDHIKALGADVKRVGFEPSFLPSDAKDLLSKELGGASLADAQFVLERLRAVKTAAELDLVREASERVVDAMTATFDICAPGMSKHDIVGRLRREEHDRDLVFEYCLIAVGNSHNRAPSDQRLKAGDVISLDSGGNYKGYIGDLSRMGVVGEPDAELHDLLQEIEEIQQVARGTISPGARGGDIIAAGEEAVRRAPHADVLDYTAHGIGLVSHEAPRLTGRGPVPYAPYDADRPLQPGMVISVETAMLHPSRGYIKLEDTLIVTEDGWEAPGDIARGWNIAGKA